MTPRILFGDRTRFAFGESTRVMLFDEDGRARAVPVAGRFHDLSPDGRRMIVEDRDGRALLTGLDGGTIAVLSDDAPRIGCAAFADGGRRILVGGWTGTVRLFDGDGGKLAEMKGHEGLVMEVSPSPDASRVLSLSNDGTARLWGVDGSAIATIGEAGEATFDMHDDRERITAAVFDPAGGRVLTGSSRGRVRLHDLDGGLRRELEGCELPVSAVAFAPDGTAFAAPDGFGGVHLWQRDGTSVGRLPKAGSGVASVAFSPDGRRVLVVSTDGTVRVDLVRAADLVEAADARLWRDFTTAEIERYDDLLSAKTKEHLRGPGGD